MQYYASLKSCLQFIGKSLILVSLVALLIASPIAFGRQAPINLSPNSNDRAQGQAGTNPQDSHERAKKDTGDHHQDGATTTDPSNPKPTPKAPDINPITNMASTSGAGYQPLTLHEQWRLYLKENFIGAGAYTGTAASALVDQLRNEPEQWGRSASGYGKRFVSRFGSNAIQGSVQAGGAALLGEDPRYIRATEKGFWRRTEHAVIYSVLTYNTDGHPTPAIANLSGYYVSSMISTRWMPGHQSIWGEGLRDANQQVVLGVAFNMVDEFWPDITRKFKRNKPIQPNP